jgi:RNA-directed DNA polymerase
MEENFTTGIPSSQAIPPLPYEELLRSLEVDIELRADEVGLYQRLLRAKLPPLVRTEVLALALGVSHKLLFAIALRPADYYRTFDIQKRSGGKRRIDAPRVFLKTIQRWILRNVLYTRELPTFVTGFVPERSLLANAQIHLRQKYLIRLDIKDFFPSVSTNRVETVFKSLEYPEKVSRLLAYLCTYRNALPQGAPTSPCLGNLVFLPCDNSLQQYAIKSNLKYSRYADDLTFSSDETIGPDKIRDLISIITTSGFQINPAKSRNWRPGQRLIATGMVVNEKVQPPRAFRRRMRAIFHQASLNPRRFKSDCKRLIGWAAFVNMYDVKQGVDYLHVARKVSGGSNGNRTPRH